MSLAWKSELATGRKMVLLALCDWANEQGECYPSVPTLAVKCSMGERTVQGHLADMEELGIIRRVMRTGRSTFYFINSAAFPMSPAESAPPQNPHPTPAKPAGVPPQNPHPTPAAAAPISTTEPSGKPSRKSSPARAARLPKDWSLPEEWKTWAIDTYPGVFTEADIAELADGFRDYWTTLDDGPRGRRTEWDGPWRNWVRNAARKMQRSSKGSTEAKWWRDDAATLAKGKELGIEPIRGESMQQFRVRIQGLIERGHGDKQETGRQPKLELADSEPPARSGKPDGLILKDLVRKDVPQRRGHSDDVRR
jgi:hypothetical protein